MPFWIMSKSAGSTAGVAVSVLFNIAVWVAPGIPERYRPPIFAATLVLLGVACAWWWFSHRAPAGNEAGVATTTRNVEGDVTVAGQQSTASKISTGAGSINAPIAGRDIIYQTPEKEEYPHILAKLQIDNLHSNEATLHAELANGKRCAENVRLYYQSAHFHYQEYLSGVQGSPSPGTIAPGQKLSSFPIENIPISDQDKIILSIYYDVIVGTSTKGFIAEHHFHLSSTNLSSKSVIKPFRSDYREGVQSSFELSWIRTLDTMSKDTGSVQFVPYAGSSESPVNMVLRVTNRLFIFEPFGSGVTFRSRINTGNR